MQIKRIEGETRALGAPVGWDGSYGECNALPIRDVMTQNGPFMVSAWEPTAEELEALKNGATLKLWIAGRIHPVVTVSVGDIEETQYGVAL